MVETIQWTDAGVVMIDQTRLPREESIRHLPHYEEVADAITIDGHPRRAGDRRGGGDGRCAWSVQRTARTRSVRTDLRHAGPHAADGGESVLGASTG